MIAIWGTYANCAKFRDILQAQPCGQLPFFTTLHLGITPIVGPEVVVDMLGS